MKSHVGSHSDFLWVQNMTLTVNSRMIELVHIHGENCQKKPDSYTEIEAVTIHTSQDICLENRMRVDVL